MRTCVLIPCYNEAGTIRDVVEGILLYVNPLRKGGALNPTLSNGVNDVIVVDDGSSDGTGDAAQAAGATVIRHKENKGKGVALKTGFNYISEKRNWDSVIIMDGDGQHDWNEIPRFMETDGSIIIGDRMSGIFPFKQMPFIRWLTNKVTSYIISKITRQRIPDSQCGYRLIRINVLKDLELITSRFDTESEILIKSAKKGYKIVSLPIKTIYHGEVSYINPVRDTMRFIRLIYNAILETRLSRRIRPTRLERLKG